MHSRSAHDTRDMCFPRGILEAEGPTRDLISRVITVSRFRMMHLATCKCPSCHPTSSPGGDCSSFELATCQPTDATVGQLVTTRMHARGSR